MDVRIRPCTYRVLLAISSLLMSSFAIAATATNPSAPYVLEAVADNLVVNASTTMATTSATEYTVSIAPSNSVLGTKTIITIDSGSTIGYSGTGASPVSITMNSANTAAQDMVIENQGTITTSSTQAIFLKSGTTSNNQSFTINNDGLISGSIITSNLRSSGGTGTAITLNLDGSSANIVGAINLSNISNSSVNPGSVFNIGATTAANFSTSATISNIRLFDIYGGSTLTLNNAANSVHTFNVRSSATATLKNTMSGESTDGGITNAGTLNLYSNITKTGTFVTSSTGNTKAYRDIQVDTSSYAINSGTHTAVLEDILNYGKVTLSNTTISTGGTLNFAVTHSGGYFPSGTLTLIAGQSAPGTLTTSKPSDTLFLSFADPVVSGNNVQITLTRTKYQSFATSTIGKTIGSNLEDFGASSSINSSMVAILNAIEESTTAEQTANALNQLAPLTSAPIYTINIQNEAIKQTELRLASNRNFNRYVAGDKAKQNSIWMRPFGASAQQDSKKDCLGYKATTGGLALGLDRKINDKMTLGFTASLAISNVNDNVNPYSTTVTKSYQGALYGSFDFDQSRYVDFVFAGTANNFDIKRHININSSNFLATANGYSQQISAKGIWGKNYVMFDSIIVAPETSVQYTFGKQYSYTEENAMGANLTVSKPNSNILQLGFGSKFMLPLQTSNLSIFMPELHIHGYYNPLTGNQNTYFNFVQGGSEMTSNFSLSRGAVKIGGGFTFSTTRGVEIKLDADYEIQDRYRGFGAYLNIKYYI